MKTILRMLAYIALLPVTGCIFPRNRDYSGDVTLNRPNGWIETKAFKPEKPFDAHECIPQPGVTFAKQ
jgi:hypothetical protein